jgi:hypothetical protein
MEYGQSLERQFPCCFIKCVAATAVFVFIASGAAAQTKAAGGREASLLEELNKYPGLLSEFSQLLQKIQREIQLPPERFQSRLLSLLPDSTIFYVALPNYGEASHQALRIFQQELQQSPVLRSWWQHAEVAKEGPKVVDFLEKFSQLSQYLGDEIVVSGTSQGQRDPTFLIVAEVRKPGLKESLSQMVKDLAGESKPAVRVLDLRELSTGKETGATQQFVVQVRPEFVVAALDLATVRNFNARLQRNGGEFVSSLFGQRVAKSYDGGTAAVAAIDLQTLLGQMPSGRGQNQIIFQRTGFADMKYLVWEHKSVAGQAASQMELSFTGPRHGVASWLAAPGPMGSLDFVSPKAVLAVSMLLKNPAQIYDDLKGLSNVSNPNAFAALAQMEQGLRLSLKDDLLASLAGEVTLEVDSVLETDPIWKAILRVSDPEHLQATLRKLLAAAPVQAKHFEEKGVAYHTFQIPTAHKTLEVAYALVDGYLIVASGHEKVSEAVRLQRNRDSLAKSKRFLESLPPGHRSEASALFYEDPLAIAALTIRQTPEMADSLLHPATETPTAIVCAYGEESALREASRSGGVDAGAVLVAAAIAIPNLLRARIAANESSSVSMVRTANTAQITYSFEYPERGFARDFASLGPDPGGSNTPSAAHAIIIEDALGNPSCTAGAWCTKSGFRFSITAVCKKQRCDEYVVVGTPVSPSTGSRSFCSTSDAVVRVKADPSITLPVSVSECRTWAPIQ